MIMIMIVEPIMKMKMKMTLKVERAVELIKGKRSALRLRPCAPRSAPQA